MQTAVEWFIDQIKEYDFTPSSNNEEYVIVMPKWIFDAKRDEAKEMEKQQIIEAVSFGDCRGRVTTYLTDEQYYNETYGSKGSETTSSQTTSDKWKEYQDWLNEVPEISDEEIEKGAKEWYEKEGHYKPSAIALKTWVYAIKWYREQLKTK